LEFEFFGLSGNETRPYSSQRVLMGDFSALGRLYWIVRWSNHGVGEKFRRKHVQLSVEINNRTWELVNGPQLSLWETHIWPIVLWFCGQNNLHSCNAIRIQN